MSFCAISRPILRDHTLPIIPVLLLAGVVASLAAARYRLR